MIWCRENRHYTLEEQYQHLRMLLNGTLRILWAADQHSPEATLTEALKTHVGKAFQGTVLGSDFVRQGLEEAKQLYIL